MIDSILACATCASNFQSETNNAAGWSIFFLLGMILPVLSGIVFFMARIIRRGENALDPELCDDLQPAPLSR